MKYLLATALSVILAKQVALAAGYCYNPFYYYGGGFFMWITTFLFIVIILYLIYAFAKKKNFTFESNDPLSILKQRLAKGEITEEEYERLKNKING